MIPSDSSCRSMIEHQLPSVSAQDDWCTFELKCKKTKTNLGSSLSSVQIISHKTATKTAPPSKKHEV